MATTVQLTIDCADPQALAQFWMTARSYVPEPPPRGHERGVMTGRDGPARKELAGALRLRGVRDHHHFRVAMRAPEGNEFDLR